MTRNATTLRRTTLAALAAATTLGLSACGGDPAEPVADAGVAEADPAEDVGSAAEDEAVAGDAEPDGAAEPLAASPYTGPYDSGFYEELSTSDMRQVDVTAAVDDVVSDRTFTITDPLGSVDATLVIEAEPIDGMDPGQEVQVQGTVRQELDIMTLEEDLGLDLDDQALRDWVGEPVIVADSVDVTPAA